MADDDPWCPDLFEGGDEADDTFPDDNDFDAVWEVIDWAPADAPLPCVYVHRQLAQCWASARMISEWLLGPGRPVVEGAALVLELGAALGLPSLAASAAGSLRCVATDVDSRGARAMELSVGRTRRAYGQPLLFAGATWQPLDWHQVPEALGELREAADVVIAADAIYESKAAAPLAAAAGASLRRGGTLIFASRRGRHGLDDFLRLAVEPPPGLGLRLVKEEPLVSVALGLGVDKGEEHGLWLFEKPAP